jgi:hypothetical protein
MGLFTSDRSQQDLGRVRYRGWEDKEPPEPTGPNEEGDRVFTSKDSRTNSRTYSAAGPSGHQYRFRGQLGGTSQWLPVRSRADLEAFEEADEYEVEGT